MQFAPLDCNRTGFAASFYHDQMEHGVGQTEKIVEPDTTARLIGYLCLTLQSGHIDSPTQISWAWCQRTSLRYLFGLGKSTSIVFVLFLILPLQVAGKLYACVSIICTSQLA